MVGQSEREPMTTAMGAALAAVASLMISILDGGKARQINCAPPRVKQQRLHRA
jgi:hypothetical protein